MKYNSKNHNKNGSNLLYLLSFIDSIDRLDTMVLEIRHLQANIIYNLRESDLFSILNYEEKYIWDTDLESIIREKNEIDTIKEKNIFYTKTIIKWIPSFPSFYDKTNQHNKSDLTKKIRRLIKNIRNKSLWSDDQQTMYHSLISLQQLKRDIVLDKINLCTFAFNANLHTTNNDTDRYIKSKFMVVRAAIMSKVSDDYVDRLFEYRQQMEFIADLSSEAMPQSSIKRRREIELYSNFLAERTRTMRTDFSLLLNEIGFNHTHNDDYLILHNWHHKYVSQSRSYKIPYDDIRPNYSTHIGSHFWTPERPDLQPIIAHEVAHIFINSELDNLKSYKLQTLSDDLSCLLIDMKKIISSYIEKAIDKDVQLGIGYEDSTTITREIACDILASSVKGQSFLYAHFLENLGFHYSFSSLVQNYDGDDIEPGLIHSARYSVENNYYHTKEWYLRSLVLISWVNNTWYKNNKNNLDNDLINGIDLIINNLMDYYTEISISEKDKYAISIWKDMTNDICKCIGSHSNLTKKIKKFRIEKEKTEYSYTSEKKFPLRAKRIDFRVRNSLYKMQMWMKSQGSRPLSKLKNNLDDDKMNDIFNDFYIGKDETQSIIENDEFETPPLYKYIYDIPWQSSLMRAKDMYWTIDAKEKISRKNNNFNNFLFEITNEFPLGRDLFSYALEFHLFASSKPSDRLILLKNLIFNSKLEHKIIELTHCNALLDKIKTIDVNYLYSSADESKKREKEHEAGTILKELYSELHKKENKIVQNKEENQDILTLYNFLSAKNNADSASNNDLINKVSSAFLFSSPVKNNDTAIFFKSSDKLYAIYMVSKFVLSATNNSHTDINKYSKIRNINNHNSNIWSGPRAKERKDQTDKYYKRLGRNDILQISSTVSLCRCPLPEIYTDEDCCKHPLFINRRELAIPVRLGKKEWSFISPQNPNNEPRPLAAISLSLRQPSFRLSFIYRLIRSIEKKKWHCKDATHLESAGNRFSVDNDELRLNDCAFLTDGRDDLLIIFADPTKITDNVDDATAKDILDRVDDIYAIQDVLYQDFMVDRTRLFFMPQALNIFNLKSAKKDYKAIIKLRLKEDRSLDLSNHTEAIMGIKGLYKTPGQYDFEIDMDEYFEGKDYDNVLKEIEDNIINIPYLDYSETLILKRWGKWFS